MEKNKFGKYLKYAIGEILLVVIGILIALQINNWNEDRKRKKLEISTLMNKAAYENLKITGIKLITNDSLRAAISDLYEGRYQYVENYMKTEYQFDQQNFGDFYLKEMEEYSFFKYAKPIDYKRLVGNQEFRNLIMHRKLKLQGWFKTQYENNIRRANRVIEMINMEIAK